MCEYLAGLLYIMKAATPNFCGFVGIWCTLVLLRGEEVWVSLATLVHATAGILDVTYVDTEV